MNTASQRWSRLLSGSAAAAMVALGWVAAGPARAQETSPAPPAPAAAAAPPVAKPPAKSTAQIDAGEPRADTSGTVPPAQKPAPAADSSPAGAPAGVSSRTPPKTAGRAPAASSQKGPGGVDRLDLGTATVTGDREQPKVMYIVPWKKSDMGDLSGKPMNSLLDEALAPVDRDEFRREVAYYGAVKADVSQNVTPVPAAKQGEK